MTVFEDAGSWRLLSQQAVAAKARRGYEPTQDANHRVTPRRLGKGSTTGVNLLRAMRKTAWADVIAAAAPDGAPCFWRFRCAAGVQNGPEIGTVA
jgi:hypothetical protein